MKLVNCRVLLNNYACFPLLANKIELKMKMNMKMEMEMEIKRNVGKLLQKATKLCYCCCSFDDDHSFHKYNKSTLQLFSTLPKSMRFEFDINQSLISIENFST